MKQLYQLLVHGNPQVDFYCKTLRRAEQNNAMQRPWLLAARVLKANILCRLKLQYAGLSLGRSYLSGRLLRPPVTDMAAQVLVCEQLITDLFGSALLRLRSQSAFDAQSFVPNRYALRLLDIARYHGVNITAVVPEHVPRELVRSLLQQHEIHVDELLARPPQNPKNACVFSADFALIRWGMQQNLRPLYYHDPRKLLLPVRAPKLDPAFAEVYRGLCGLHLFGGDQTHSPAYEHAYLCLAPAVFAGVAQLPQNADEDTRQAVADFTHHLNEYIQRHDPDFVVDPESAARLYALTMGGKI